jgi:anthranilate synthase component 1
MLLTRPDSGTELLRGPFQAADDAFFALHVANPDRYPFLLESTAVGALGRFDILFAFPEDRLLLSGRGILNGGIPRSHGSCATFLDALDAGWRHATAAASGRWPFSGGWFLYLGYELAGEIERSLTLPHDAALPIAEATRVRTALIRDRLDGRVWIVGEPGCDLALADIERDLRAARARAPLTEALVHDFEEDAPVRYLEAVRRALAHISAGDVYQANLSRAWRARLAPTVTAADVYQRLRRVNPAPFCALAHLEGRTIVSSSPERLVAVRQGMVMTRPIAGTRPRGATPSRDSALRSELAAHPKERAEHVMLIDLERNDLGRICEAGTVEVDEYMTIESYAHVHHIVSNVRGRLRADVTAAQVIRAVFPGGTITGCPKVRCMEIIGALEGEARGAYTGSVGYLGLDGSMDLNILIRTMEISHGALCFRAGAGIVADSIPERELEETRAKARGLINALGYGPDA